MTLARLAGLYAPDFVREGRQWSQIGSAAPGADRAGRLVPIGDARALQAAEAVSEAEFFARHSFVLLPHDTAMADWDKDVASVYLPEIEQVIRERLLPGRRVEISPAALQRRGRGTAMPFYADGVHSDGGLDVDDYVYNIEAFSNREAARLWRARYARDDVAGLVWIDFWRPTNMAGPLEHRPLALCDPTSLSAEDVVPSALTGLAPNGRVSHHLSLRFNPRQSWYHYPKMTCREMLAFKLAAFWKDHEPPRNCFHSAFHHPDTPAHVEERQSCELRLGVIVLKS